MGPKGVANVTRQTWDLEQYEKLAQLRASGQLDEDKQEEKKVIKSNRQEFKTAQDGAAGPAGSARAFLTSRTERVTLDEKVGSVRVVRGEDALKSNGYYCEVCERALKDSVAYLDHINGKRHLQKLGFSMRVERSSVDQVKSRLQNAAKRKYETVLTQKVNAVEAYEMKKRELEEEEAQRKRQRRESRKSKKNSDDTNAIDTSEEQQDQGVHSENDSNNDDSDEKTVAESETRTAEQIAEEEMMAMMGFGGFGGSNKNN